MIIYKLYLKTHNITGMQYLGCTKQKNPYKYPGSGKYWKLHLQKHGFNNISTDILSHCKNSAELEVCGLFFSKLFNVVESSDFANLVNETGIAGSIKPVSKETRLKMSLAKKGKPKSASHKVAMREAAKTRKRSPLSEATKQKLRGPRGPQKNPKRLFLGYSY